MTAETDGILRTLLRLIRGVSGARMVSLYLAMPDCSAVRPVLVHDGEPPAASELADLSSAAEFARTKEPGDKIPAEPAEWHRLRPIESAGDHAYLIRVPALEALIAAAPEPAPSMERRGARTGSARLLDGTTGLGASAWLAVRFEPPKQGSSSRPDDRGLLGASDEWWSRMLALASGLAWHARWALTASSDPVSDLPGRSEFHTLLERSLRQGDGRTQLGLIFVNPDDFVIVNERFGREAGDIAIHEIGQRLRLALRRTDFAFRHGAAVFGALLPLASIERLSRVSEKLSAALGAKPYLDGSVPLTFSVGTAFHEGSGDTTVEEQALQLVRKADRALNAAKVSGGGRIITWSSDLDSGDVSQYDRLSGIYTSNPTQDYRNMLLLWETVGIVAAHDDAETLVVRVLEKLAGTFKTATLSFVWCDEDGRPGSRVLRLAGDTESVERVDSLVFDTARRKLFEEARSEKRTVTHRFAESVADAGEESELCCSAMPLRAGGEPLGYLYMEWRTDLLHLGPADLAFLDALAGQLTMALDRARLVEQEAQRQEREKEVLLGELTELREALQHAQVVYRSPAMDAVLASAGKVAVTDVTVLVSGESGTGKEMLARTIHQLSPRRDKHLVVVDCGAVATSLFDSELFGHERGAYTGAERRSIGRIAEADGGTLLLDEIGELPLEVQSKMLRFVQEKQITPVGGTQPQSVDVRVIAATNRDLAAEVAAGKFREDLYHRLNVVQMVVPPLRERPEDISLLAQHFLEQFSIQYGKRVRRLSGEAMERLRAHSWPGNVRELQNRMMRAVVLCGGDQIEAAELELDPAAAGEAGAGAASGRVESRSTNDGESGPSAAAGSRPSAEPTVEGVLQALSGQIDTALRDGAFPPPLGKWIGEDLVLQAYDAARETASRAATLLAIPETTFRRRLRKAQAGAGIAHRPAGWDRIREQVAKLIEAGNPAAEDLLERLRLELLDEIARRLPEDVKRASALLGVTDPTYRRWVAERADRS